jgi:hypothetical protein
MNIENIVMLNFFLTVALAFIAYRQHVVGAFRRERDNEEIHQEIRNSMDYVNGRLDNFEDRMDRDMLGLYKDMDRVAESLPKKKTTGMNSRIPL